MAQTPKGQTRELKIKMETHELGERGAMDSFKYSGLTPSWNLRFEDGRIKLKS
jgi:hypothetical protein